MRVVSFSFRNLINGIINLTVVHILEVMLLTNTLMLLINTTDAFIHINDYFLSYLPLFSHASSSRPPLWSRLKYLFDGCQEILYRHHDRQRMNPNDFDDPDFFR